MGHREDRQLLTQIQVLNSHVQLAVIMQPSQVTVVAVAVTGLRGTGIQDTAALIRML
tara:strand:+ start:227 stop:397 length:171 start_codon:yes stop_codon:yes gene_type:complete